jgi:hypothetical protein
VDESVEILGVRVADSEEDLSGLVDDAWSDLEDAVLEVMKG